LIPAALRGAVLPYGQGCGRLASPASIHRLSAKSNATLRSLARGGSSTAAHGPGLALGFG